MQPASYLSIESSPTKRRTTSFEISFAFRTFESTGLLLYHTLKSGYLKVFLDNARLKVQLVNAKESLNFDSFDLSYDDGQWHQFKLAYMTIKVSCF